jgi:hypothetical protein
MLRLYPKTVQNKVFLSRLLEYYLVALQDSPYQLSLHNLSWDTRIPESVLRRLLHYYRTPEDHEVVTVEDFHIAFANIMVHYPTVRLWWDVDGQVYVSM